MSWPRPKKKSAADYEAECRSVVVRADLLESCLLHPTGDVKNVARRVYVKRHGQIPRQPSPQRLCVCHHCDVPNCIRDSHHFLGTHKENTQDASRKGRLKHTPEELAKMRAALKGKKKSLEHCARMSAFMTGRPSLLKGKTKSAAAKARLSLSWTPERRAKMSAVMAGNNQGFRRSNPC